MQFGLINAQEILQRLMSHIFQGLPFVRVCLDDVVIFYKTTEEQIDHMRQVLERIARNSLKIKVNKCFFAKTQTQVLGHIIVEEEVKIEPQKIEAIKKIPVPR